MEDVLAWPWQLMHAIVHLAPKPSGGDRGLFALPLLARVWGRLRRAGPDGWCSTEAAFWGQAVAGSSALQAA
eukprot:5949498-Lingulodinium_polyedra.AAC.1